MKKVVVGLLAAGLVVGGGTAVFAATDSVEKPPFTFEQMLPHMQEMHPDLTQEQLQDMYNDCHANGGSGAGMHHGQGPHMNQQSPSQQVQNN